MQKNNFNSNLWRIEGKKTAPISLRATLKGIRIAFSELNSSESNQRNNYKTFAEMDMVKATFKKIHNLYKYSGTTLNSNGTVKYESKKFTTAESIIRRCETNPSEPSNASKSLSPNFISYIDLRSYAELYKIPTGMLLLFSHMLGDEFRIIRKSSDEENRCMINKSSDHLIDSIDKKIACLEAAKKVIHQNRELGKPAFVKLDRDARVMYKKDLMTTPYYADVSILLVWKEILN